MPRRGKSRKGVGHAHPKPIFGSLGKTLKRCKNDAKADVIIIDVDDDDGDDDILDVPEFPKHNVQGSSVSKNDRCQVPTVICIDEDDEVSHKSQPDISVEGTDDSNSSSSSKYPPSYQTGNSPDEDADECQFLHETSPVKLSKCKRTYCAKSLSGNRYGLGPDSDGDLDGEQSDKDQLDSECMEDKLGELRVLWEKANKMRKSGAKSGGSAKDGQFTTSSAKQKVPKQTQNECEEAAALRTQHSPDTKVDNGAPSSSNNLHREFDNGCSSRNEDEREVGLQEDKEGQLDDEAGGDVDTMQDCLINNREKLKETNEYKRAEEEEWASRQEALRLQAEEAQRARLLLKRKKAQSLRLQDMERRQKQRVEEIRKTQKKDEEDMNMKEKLRAEVRNELKQLEMKSLDMGSLLQGLGVHVSGGLQPQQHEIRAAYKRALLTFHPDRAPTSDIRKLVEAEEKFKLISRMKDKFFPA